jgi:hypothetical protein
MYGSLNSSCDKSSLVISGRAKVCSTSIDPAGWSVEALGWRVDLVGVAARFGARSVAVERVLVGTSTAVERVFVGTGTAGTGTGGHATALLPCVTPLCPIGWATNSCGVIL